METTNFFKESLKFDEKRKEESKIVRNLFITRLRNNLKGQARFIREEIYIDEDDRKEAVQSSIGKTIKESAYNKNKHVYDNLKD